MNLRGMTSAFRTLSILPFPGKDADCLSDALPFFSVVGLVLGCIAGLAAWVIQLFSGWSAGAGTAAVLLLILLTRGLHLDGLGDVADALGASTDRGQRLKIMKDPHCGAFAIIAIVSVIMIKAVSSIRLAEAGHFISLILPVVISRSMLVLLCASLPYARSEGGKAQNFVANSRAWHVLSACGIAFGISCSAGLLGVSAFLSAALLASGLRLWMRKNFGGITGDLLGFGNETIEAALLTFLALFQAG